MAALELPECAVLRQDTDDRGVRHALSPFCVLLRFPSDNIRQTMCRSDALSTNLPRAQWCSRPITSPYTAWSSTPPALGQPLAIPYPPEVPAPPMRPQVTVGHARQETALPNSALAFRQRTRLDQDSVIVADQLPPELGRLPMPQTPQPPARRRSIGMADGALKFAGETVPERPRRHACKLLNCLLIFPERASIKSPLCPSPPT
jgi:hypothetical protein